MKKIFLFSLIMITLLWCGLMLAQESSLVTDPKAKVVTQFLNPDAECTGEGELIYDDGTFEDGFGWNWTVTDGRIVTLFTPHSYPWQFNTFCLALTRLAAGTPNFTFDIVMYDNTGAGATPGNQIGIVASVNAIDIPIWTTLAFYDFDITSMPPLASGSVYIGIKYNPSLVASPHFSLVDQTPTTPLHPGYVKSDSALWQPIQSILPGSKAISYRTLGSSNCPVDPASNPDPPNGTLNVPIYGSILSWVNGSGTLDVEVWFGPYYNVVKVYDGPAISSFALPTLDYYTQYQWYVVCKNDTCANQGSIWNFTTQTSFGWVFDIYPLNIDYWTGTCDPTVITQNSLVKADGNGYAGWMVFDTTPLGNDPNIIIISIEFNAYLYDNNWPYWAITPMDYVNPITGTASEIYSQVSSSYTEGMAYSYNPETGSLDNGWIQRELTDGGANQALENALSQGWFAIGIYDWDNSPIYYVRFQGWAEGNKPFLRVNYLSIPVELISFIAEVDNNTVTLFWQTATETNNQGFEIERLKDSKIEKLQDWERIGFVEGKGTTTEIQSYSFTDKPEPGKYKYRLKQIDFDGTFAYSPEVRAEVKAPNVFSLEQNYPNPFNPNTVISYQLPATGNVTLKVYDILGNEVATLINEEQEPGVYEIEFNVSQSATGGSRPEMTSGVYFYQLKAGSYVETKKMILLK